MDLPKRKQIRLPKYDYSSPGAYFVTICTHERKRILSQIAVGADALGGPTLQLSAEGKTVEKYILSTDRIPGVHVDKYIIMPNHVHMILSIDADGGPPRAAAPTASIPRAVSALKRFANRDLHRNIWQRSYHEHIICGAEDHQQIWEYIDTNPAKWAEDRYYST